MTGNAFPKTDRRPRRGGVPIMNRGHALGLASLLMIGSAHVLAATAQDPVQATDGERQAAGVAASAGTQDAVPLPLDAPAPPDPGTTGEAGNDPSLEVAQLLKQDVKPLTEGPLHEAFLSPRKDSNPVHIGKTPPAPITERPAVDPPARTRSGSRGTGNGTRAGRTISGSRAPGAFLRRGGSG